MSTRDTAITTIYCLCDDFLNAVGHREDPQTRMSDAEVMTTALVASRYFRGVFEEARDVLAVPTYIPAMLSKSQFNRRLHRLAGRLRQLFDVLAHAWITQAQQAAEARDAADAAAEPPVFLLDTFPVACCDNIRIRRSRLYPETATDGAFRGYIASKKRYFYGLKIVLMTTAAGHPVEVFLAPGSFGDVDALKRLRFDLPEGATLYGDKAFNDYAIEDEMREAGLMLSPLRRKNSKRAVPAWVAYVQHRSRKFIETVGSQLERLLPKSIHAVTARGFELKVFLFVLAYSITTAM